MIDTLKGRAELILELLADLMGRSSLSDFNAQQDGVFLIGRSHFWRKLDEEARQLQSRLLQEIDRYAPLVESLVRLAPEKARKDVAETNETLRDMTDQSKGSYYRNPASAIEAARKGVGKQLEHLDSLYDPSGGTPIYIPDANAAVRNPQLDGWEFANAPKFTLVLTPTFLRELDDLKMTHRVEDVRRASEAVVGQIKEFDRRGDVHGGVTLRSGRSQIRLVAAEADFGATLTWLDPTVNDDRLVAEALEVARQHPRSAVTLVTGDINLRNKARAAGLPYVDEPALGRRSSGQTRNQLR